MKKILDFITGEMVQAFKAAGYDASYAKVSLSNRPERWQLRRHTRKPPL